MKKTMVIGASPNAERYSNKAVRLLHELGHEVIALGLRKGQIGDVQIITERPEKTPIDTVTLYLNASSQRDLYNYLIKLKPRRIIFNPGAENVELSLLAKQQGIETIEACTLVMLRSNQYD